MTTIIALPFICSVAVLATSLLGIHWFGMALVLLIAVPACWVLA